MNSVKKLLGARIKEIRKSKGLTQLKLSELINVDSKHLSRIEVGSSFPSIDALEKIATSLNIEVKELFNVAHLKDKEELLQEIADSLKTANIENVRLAYRLINDLLQ